VGRTLLGTRHQVRTAHREQTASERVGGWMPTRDLASVRASGDGMCGVVGANHMLCNVAG